MTETLAPPRSVFLFVGGSGTKVSKPFETFQIAAKEGVPVSVLK
jgi:hypothetical protein